MIACKSVKDMNFDKVNLENNRIEGKPASDLIKSIDIKTKKINLSKNKLGIHALQLQKHIMEKQTK